MKTNKNITLDIDIIRAVNGTLELNGDPRTFSGLITDLLKNYLLVSDEAAAKAALRFRKPGTKSKRTTGAK